LKKKEEIIYKICLTCAKKRKMILSHNHVASFWEGICDVCGKFKDVTDPQDFKYLTEDF